MAIDFGRVEVVHAILQARPRMACLRLISFPHASAIKFVLENTSKSKYANNEALWPIHHFILSRHLESATNLLCFDFAVVAMLFSFAKFGCVLFSQNKYLNPLESYLAPSLVESLENFATFRYDMV
jgi:hypothetical protein